MSEYEDRIKASPAAKRLAQELGIDITKVKGTGSDGRIQLSDIENFKPTEIMQAADELTEDDFSDITLTVDNLAIGEDDDDFFDLRTPPVKNEQAPVYAYDSMSENREPSVKPKEFDFSEPEPVVKAASADVKPEVRPVVEPVKEKTTEDMSAEIKAPAIEKPTIKPARKSIFDILADDDDTPVIEIPVKKPAEKAPQGFSTPFAHDEKAEEVKSVFAEEKTDLDEAEVKEEVKAEVKPVGEVLSEMIKNGPTEPTEEAKEEMISEEDDTPEETTSCGCGHEHHHEHDEECECDECECDDEYDDEYDDEEEEVQPLHIVFKVKCEHIDFELDKYGLSVNSALLDAVMKSLAYAVYDADNDYDGRINVVTMDREDINVRTAADTLTAPIGKISLEDPSEHDDDIFVNVWDMTNFGFSSYNRPDPGMLNVFVTMRNNKVKVEMLIDEYAVDLYTSTIIAEDFRLNLNRVSLVADRKPEEK